VKKIICFLSVVVIFQIASKLYAQDKIYLKSGENIEAKILEINLDEIKYKKFSYLEGPTFTILKSDIQMLIFENGETEMFNDTNNKSKESRFSVRNDGLFNKHRVNIEIIGIASLGPSSFSYEKLNETGKMGLEIPFNIHYDSDGVAGYTSGVNLKFYTSGEGEWFFIGPSMALGFFEYYFYDYDYYIEETTFAIVPGLKLGVQYQITDVFGLNLSGTTGYILPLSGEVDGDFAISLNLGFNFSF